MIIDYNKPQSPEGRSDLARAIDGDPITARIAYEAMKMSPDQICKLVEVLELIEQKKRQEQIVMERRSIENVLTQSEFAQSEEFSFYGGWNAKFREKVLQALENLGIFKVHDFRDRFGDDIPGYEIDIMEELKKALEIPAEQGLIGLNGQMYDTVEAREEADKSFLEHK